MIRMLVVLVFIAAVLPAQTIAPQLGSYDATSITLSWTATRRELDIEVP